MVKKSEEPSKEITVKDFNRDGRLFLVREYGSEYGPALMEHHVFIGDREGIRMEPLKEIENVNEKTLPPAESYRAPQGITAAALGETRLTYDNKGRITQVQRFKPNGELIDRSTYKYDDRGRRIEYVLRSIFENEPQTTTYRYNDEGQLTEQIETGSRATFTTTYSGYKFDGHGNWIERTTLFTTKPRPEWQDLTFVDVPREAKFYRTIIYHEK